MSNPVLIKMEQSVR